MKEWYLIGNKTKPNMIGGYENQSFIDCKEDAFLESLETDIATTVLLCNYDLSETKEIRGIIQGNTADTQLKSMERSILVPIGTLKAGNYIFYENEYWLIMGRPGNNKIYEKATLIECQYLLKWQNTIGDIIERWVNITSASKYDVGENDGKTIVLTSNNYTILIPNDNESFELNGKRVFIDLSSTNPERVFKITRTDDPLYNYNSHGGVLSLIADKTELNKNKDNQQLRICDYIDISNPSTPLPSSPSNPDETTVSISAAIQGKKELKCGFPRSYTAILSDEDGDAIAWDNTKYDWNVVSDFDVEHTANGNKIELYVEDEELIDSSFLLQVINKSDNTVISESKITVVEGW